MRFIFLLSTIVLWLYSCNNDLSGIGQDLINNGNQIEVKSILLSETGTIKIDSFITSSGRYGKGMAEMYMGRYEDVYSGTTMAYPCFQLVPAYQPSIASRFTLDSVTFHFNFGEKIWGDTVNPVPQTFTLYQLSDLPTLKTDDNDYFYNTNSIPWGKELARTSFIPKNRIMKYVYFRLPNDEFTEDLFNKMKNNDPIFKPVASSSISYYKFLNYFKGLAIQTSADNNCLFSIQMKPDSLYMRFHYHDSDIKNSFDLKLLTESNKYQYYTIKNEPAPQFAALTNQKDEVPFTNNKLAMAQGLSGYMVKINIPEPEIPETFKTVVKAEIEIKPKVWYSPIVASPSMISVYHTNKLNEIKDIVFNSTDNPVIGKYKNDPGNLDNNRYIFDITDYYQQLSTQPSQNLKREILLTIPNLTSSFDRMLVKDTPILRVYYATYKD
ncbi:MAG: DUF4270 family protein [Odoribacter sp.]